MTKIIAFANQKGGVAKTTSAIALAQTLAMEGKRILFLDLDPQENASNTLRVNHNHQRKKLDKYFPKDFTPAQKEERIIKALDFYCRRLERMKQEQEYAR